MTTFGWTQDAEVLEILGDLWGTADELLSNRKCGGVHRVWTWPLGHPDWEDDWYTDEVQDPIWTRADVAYGRYLKDGCTFLVWDYMECGYTPRPGTLEDARWLQKGVNGETKLLKIAEECRVRREQQPARLTEGYTFTSYNTVGGSYTSTPPAPLAAAQPSAGKRPKRRFPIPR